MFVSAGWPIASTGDLSAKSIADAAMQSGILLAPAEFFTLSPANSVWFRFNVAYTDSDNLAHFLTEMGEKLFSSAAHVQNEMKVAIGP